MLVERRHLLKRNNEVPVGKRTMKCEQWNDGNSFREGNDQCGKLFIYIGRKEWDERVNRDRRIVICYFFHPTVRGGYCHQSR